MNDKNNDPDIMQIIKEIFIDGKISNINSKKPLITHKLNMRKNPNVLSFYESRIINFQNQSQAHVQGKDEIWTIIFERKYDNNKITIQIKSNETVGSAYSKYRIKALEDIIPLKISFEGKSLDTFLILNQSGLTNNSTITVEKEIDITLLFENNVSHQIISIGTTKEELLKNVFQKYCNKTGITGEIKFIFNQNILNPELTGGELGLKNLSRIFTITVVPIIGGAYPIWNYKEINIKFIKISINIKDKIFHSELNGLLMLCLLKDISSKLDFNYLIKLHK